MEQSDRLERAQRLAPDLAEPSDDHPASKALTTSRILLTLFRVGWVAVFAFMVVGSLSAGASGFVLIWLVGVCAIFGFGWTLIRQQAEQLKRRMHAPFEREAVVILDKQVRGRQRAVFITVANREGRRRELVVWHQPGLLIAGDVGVLFSRADVAWSFHRVD